MAIRDLIKSLSPSTMQAGRAERLLYVMGLGGDALLDKLTQGVYASLPTKADASALPFIGADLLIPKGLSEADASYALRLQRALDDWRIAGNAWSVLRQTLSYLLTFTPQARTVSDQYNPSGVLVESIWNTFDEGADTTKPPRHESDVAGFDWDSTTPTQGSWGWWRAWVILYATSQAWCGPAPFKFGTSDVRIGERPDVSIGLNISPAEVSSIRSIVSLWKAKHAWVKYIIVSFSDVLFDPTQGIGGGVNPDGQFGKWGKVVVGAHYAAARFTNARYITGALQ
jgi:hypothetical protein